VNEQERKEIDAFYDAEHDNLFRFIRNQGLDAHDADDVLNDAFLAVCAHWSDVRDGSPRGYLYAAARNELHRRWRLRGRRPDGRLEREFAAETTDFAQQLADRQGLRWALGKLSGREREAVLLIDGAQFNVAGAAQIMGCTPGTVKRYAFNGRAKLRRLLDDGGTPSGTRKEGT
jgi:RNA polymerase sigma factor (sigma-70 family)